MDRRSFLQIAGAATGAPLAEAANLDLAARLLYPSFVFARARYQSGNWDTDANLAKNFLASLGQYSYFRADRSEQIVSLESEEILSFPFVFLSGNEAVRFSRKERETFERYVRGGGFLFVDDCNHDIGAIFASTFEDEVCRIFQGSEGLRKISPDHVLYRSYFDFGGGPPTTSQELNGWGDDVVHDYLKGVEIGGRLAILYSNKDYGCEWNYDATEPAAPDSIKFAVNIVSYVMSNCQTR